MKNRFILSSLFLLGCTGLIQADSTPTLSRVYGDQFTAGIASTQPAGAIGQLVPTGVFGTNGSLSIDTQLSGGQARAVQVLSDGTFVVALSLSTSSVLAKYSTIGTIQSTAQFGTSGVAALGAGTTENALAMIVDTQGRLLVSGGSLSAGTAGWLKRVSADGDTVQTFDTTTGTPWRNIGGIAQQSSGKIITVGFNGTNAQIARYTIGTAIAAGILDTTFGVGATGLVPFNGTNSLPTSTHGLYSVYVDASDNIYVLMLDSAGAGAAYIVKLDSTGAWVGTYGEITAISGSTEGQFKLAFDDTNLILAGQIAGTPDIVKVTARTLAGGAVGGFTNFLTTSITGHTADAFALYDLKTTSDGKIYLLGSDTTTTQMSIIRLVASSGAIDTAFNTTGYNFFSIAGGTITASQIQAMSVAPDGQLYTVGYQTVNTPTTTPYVSVLYNDLYVSQVAQDPATTEMGNLDLTFGTVATETYAGVTTPFNGMYGSSLLQQANDVIEITTTTGVPAVGQMLVGMSGFTNASASSSMMFTWLTSAGAVDASINPSNSLGSAGSLVLTHDITGGFSTTYPNEYLTSVLQGAAGVVYVSGYASETVGGAAGAATLRAYSPTGTTTWTDGAASFYASESGAGYKGLAVGTQAFSSPTSTRILLFVQDSATTGHISGYTTSGSLDTVNFGLSPTGKIPTSNAAYPGLAMGPVYGGLVTPPDQNIVVAYKNSGSAAIDVAMFTANGSALQTTFNPTGINPGIVPNVFSDAIITLDNVRLGFIKKPLQNNFLVGAVTSTQLLLASIDPDGNLDSTFGSEGILTQTITGATSLKLKEITGISDGTILATFYDDATDDTMYTARITAAGALDTTFNSQGSQPGVLPIQIGNEVADYNSRIMTSALIQSTVGANQGNIVLAGYESVTTSDSTPIVMRSYGTSGTTEIPDYSVADTTVAGTFEAAFDLNSVFGTSGGKVVYTYPAGNTYAGKMLVGVDNGTDSKIARIDVSSQALDTTFGTAGVYTIAGLPGINCLTVDANNYILAGGTTSDPLGWAVQITPSATGVTPQLTMTMPTGATTVTGVNQILQQKSGRYIVAAKGTNTTPAEIGVLIGFRDKLVTVGGVTASTLVVDPTFNPQITGAVPAGSCSLGVTPGCYSIALNSDDTILAATATGGFVIVTNITANGSGYVSTFASGSPLTTNVPTAGASVCQVAIDSAGKVVVAASNTAGTAVAARRYLSTGATDTTWNGDGSVQTISNVGTAGVVLADMMQTITQQTVLVGYNTAGGNGLLFAVRLDSAGELDATWNPIPAGTDTAGVLTYGSGTTPAATTLSDAAITINGNIVSVGSTAGTGGHPIITFVYGDSYVTEQAQQPLEAAAGTLDLTIPGGSTGSLVLSSLPGGGAITGVPQRMYIYNSTINGSANGAMLIASVSTSGTPTVYVTQLNADLTKAATYGGGFGFGTDGVASFTPNTGASPSSVTITDLYVANGTNDTAQPIYITGYTTTTGGVNTAFAAQIASTGVGTPVQATPVTGLSATTASPVSGGIRQSTNSKVFVSGYNGTTGIVAAYNSAMTALDTSFGNHSGTLPNYGTGYFTTGVNNPIVAMTTDNSDRIYIAYKTAATTIAVVRLLANGTAVDPTFSAIFTTGTQVGGYSATQIKMAIDLTNSRLIVAALDGTGNGNIIQVARFNFSGTAQGAISTVTVAGATLQLSDLFIDNDTSSTDATVYPNIYVVGYISAGTGANNSVVARIATTSTTGMALDSTYGSSGIANLTSGSMTVVTAGALDPDRRVYMVGSNTGATLGFMGRNFGDQYWTQASPAILKAVVGAVDLTLYPNYTGGLNLQGLSGWSGLTGYTAQAIIENQNGDGTSYIAFANGTNLIVGQVNADMIPVATGVFGIDGLTSPLAMATVTSISIDSLGNILVAGTEAGALKSVIFSSVGALTATLATTGSTVGTTIAQQKSGRYIVGGLVGGNGAVCAYQNASAISGGALGVDTTFGPASLNSYYSTGVATQVDDLCIDSNDYIYIAYRAAGGQVSVSKLTPEGALSTVSNTPTAQVWTSNPRVVTGIVATQPARIAINSAGNLLVGATTGVGTNTVLVALVAGADSTLTAAITITAGTNSVLTKLVGAGSASGSGAGTEFYGSIYDSSTQAIAFAVTGLGAIDTAFGSSGYLNIATATVTPTTINGISVQADGKVVMVGGNVTPVPVLVRGYGYPYVAQFAQEPDQAAAGTLDTTLWPTTGALELDIYTPISTAITNAVLTGSTVSRIYEYSNGNALLLFSGTSTNTTSVLARVLKDLTLDTVANGGSGFGSDTGFVTIANTNANALFVDGDSNIFVAGGTGAASWVAAYNSAGAALPGWVTPVSNLALGAYEIAEQSSQRVILAGKGVTNGTLYGYTTGGILDTTFGTAGVVDMGSTQAITDITIDYYDDIIAVSTAGTTGTPANVVLKKVQDSGGTVTTLSGGTAVANSTGNPKVILDSSSASAKIIVASATNTGFTLARYNNDATGTDSGSQVTIAAGGSNTSVLGNIYATSDGKVVLVGYETTGNTVVVVRLTSGFVVDTTFGTNGVLATTIGAVQFLAKDGMISADDRIMLAGGSGAGADPYLARVFGDDYVTYVTQAPSEAVPGTIDTSWGSTTPPTGIYNLSGLAGITANSQGKAILPLANGGYYMALTSGTDMQLIRTVAEGTLDATFGPSSNGLGQGMSSFVVTSMMMDGSSRLVLTSSNSGSAQIARYESGNSGYLDTTFGTGGLVTVSGATEANALVEQTLARYVVAGKNATGGALYAYTALDPSNPTATGVLDTTFGAGTGLVQITTGGGNGIYNLIADQYDRLIFAVLNTAGTGIDLYRLTPTGELDATFGTAGKVANVFTTTTSGTGVDASSIRVALDSVGNIVVAAYVYTAPTANIKIAAYDNGTLTTTSGNGGVWTNAYTIPNVVGAVATISLTDLATTADNYVLVLGNATGVSSTLSPTWIARLANTASAGIYVFDTTFNPTAMNGVGTPAAGIVGIFEYSNTTLGTTSPYHVYNAMTVRPDGRLGVVGYENTGGVSIPTVIRVNDDPYTTETVQSPNSKAVGTNDQTLGASPTFYTNLGVTFFGATSSLASYGQVARAIALQDYNNIVVAVDGASSTSAGASQIFMTKFDTDGILNPSFSTDGMATVLTTYAAQNVQDMVTFATVAGVNKAILAGYVTNSTLSSVDSLLLQYNLDTAAVDTANFGGFNGNPQGVAFGDGKQLNSVARQTTGRIIAAGISKDNLGLLLGYTSAGKLDDSFGNDGYLAVTTTTGLFTHAVDTLNRVVVAYRAGGVVVVARYLADGSGLDTSFGTASSGIFTTVITVAASSDVRIALTSSNTVVIAAVTGGTAVTINSYADATAGTPFVPTIGTLTAFTIARLLIDVDGKAVVVGSDTNGGSNDQVVIARTNTALSALDATFNQSGTQGYLKYAVAAGAVQAATSAMIHPDGRILIIGSETV